MPPNKILSVGCLATILNERYQMQIKGCCETWVEKCKELDIPVYFFCGSIKSDNEEVEPSEVIHLEGVLDDVMSATDKQWLGLKWMYENSPSKWYLLTGTDNYIFPKRILKELKKHESEDFDQKPLYLGGHAGNININPKMTFKYYSGSGFFLNHAALKELIPEITKYKEDWLSLCKWYTWLQVACDAAIGYYAKEKNFELIDLQGIYACDWQGMSPGVAKCCFPIDHNKCLILHRCNYLDHHAVKRYSKNQHYKSLAYCFLLSQLNWYWKPIVNRLYEIGNSVKVVRDLHKEPCFGTFPVLRGMIDSLRTDKGFISEYTDEYPVKNWLEMADIKEGQLNEVDFLIVPEGYTDFDEVVTSSVKYVLTYSRKPVSYLQLNGFRRECAPPSPTSSFIYLFVRNVEDL